MAEKIYSVAVDGPSGAGKSTLARAVAEELGILYVDTGAIYRTIGCYMLRRHIDPKDAASVIASLGRFRVELRHGADGQQHMLLDGADVTEEIRRNEVSAYASDVSAIPEVRTYLMDMQRSLAREQSVIMDGRDIGTVVLPQADVKIFLFASAEVRAQRRTKELAERGTPRPYEEVLREMEQRDYNDMHRQTAPLRPADDAIMIDTSEIGFYTSRNLLLDVIKGSVGI